MAQKRFYFQLATTRTGSSFSLPQTTFTNQHFTAMKPPCGK